MGNAPDAHASQGEAADFDAANEWRSISQPQRRTLLNMQKGASHGASLATLRALAGRGLVSWGDGPFSREARVVLTERGRLTLNKRSH